MPTNIINKAFGILLSLAERSKNYKSVVENLVPLRRDAIDVIYMDFPRLKDAAEKRVPKPAYVLIDRLTKTGLTIDIHVVFLGLNYNFIQSSNITVNHMSSVKLDVPCFWRTSKLFGIS